MEFIIITGLSGAGKTTVVHSLEDMGFYCVDNLPPQVLPVFWNIIQTAHGKFTRVAVVVDPRSGEMFNQLQQALYTLTNDGCPYMLLFLEASDKTLINRYKESRRQHPLAKDRLVTDGIRAERSLLAQIKRIATHEIDTSNMHPKELSKYIKDMFWSEQPVKGMQVNVLSFGFKYGVPSESDLVFDVRFLPNPFYIPELKGQTGLDRPVWEYVLSHKVTLDFLGKLNNLVEFLLPEYVQEGKAGLVISVGCTGGKHRSVTCAEELTKFINSLGYSVASSHRDIDK